MSNPRAAHPLDVDLVDFVDGSLDAADARIVEEHLDACLSCRIKRQRIAQTPPIDLADLGDINSPDFDPIEVEEAEPGDATAGELWLTANDDAAMVLVTKVRPNGWGVVVVPVVFDTEIADNGTLVLDETASPLAVPIAVYDGMLNSLPTSALRGRVVPRRQGVDLLTISDADSGVTRGTPLEGPADPRHEVRQYVTDRVIAMDPPTPESPPEDTPATSPIRVVQHLDQATVDERFKELQRAFLARPDAEVSHLPLKQLLGIVPASWEGIAQVEWFNQRVLLLLIEGGLPDDRGPALALCARFRGSAIAVHTHAYSRLADLYPHSALVGAHSVQTGATMTEPVLTGVATDIIRQYLERMVEIPTITRSAVARRAPVDPKEILGGEVDAALAVQVTVGRAARTLPKAEGLTSVGNLGSALTDALRQVFSGDVDPAVIVDLADGRDR